MNAQVPSVEMVDPEKKQARAAKRKAARSKKKDAMALLEALTVAKPNSKGVRSVKIPQGQKLLVGRGRYDYAVEGGRLGADLGGRLGTTLGSAVSTILGRGDYTVRRNNIMKSSTEAPRIRSTNGSTVLCHKEFLGDVIATGSTAWQILNSYNINPLLSSVFPFASQLATAYEEYEPYSLVLVYEPTSGFMSTTQAVGCVNIGTQYDLQDPVFLTQNEMLDYEFSTLCAPFEPMIHPIECDPRQNQLQRFYCRSGNLTGTNNTFDARYNEYDLGRVSVAIGGCPAAAGTVLGKLFWSYEFAFHKPKLYGSLMGNNLLYDDFFGTWNFGTQVTSLSNLIVGQSATLNTNTLGCSISVPSTNNFKITFPSTINFGVFEVLITNSGNPNTISNVNMTNVTAVNGGLVNDFACTAATGTLSSYCCAATVTVNSANATFTFNNFITATTGGSSNFYIAIFQSNVSVVV